MQRPPRVAPEEKEELVKRFADWDPRSSDDYLACEREFVIPQLGGMASFFSQPQTLEDPARWAPQMSRSCHISCRVL